MLDVTLPKLDGVSLYQRLRDVRRQNHSSLRNSALPVLMLTARDTLADKIIGLDAGSDDYMTKPFEMLELMARIRAMLRHNSVTTSADLCWGSLRLNSSTY